MKPDAIARERAMQLLAEAVEAAGKKGKAGVAERINCSRSLISRVISPNDNLTMSDRLAEAVLREYDRPICPHDGLEKPPAHCRRIALRPRPHGFPDAEILWLTCQTCPNNPLKGVTVGEPS